jgi:hypothetical protein
MEERHRQLAALHGPPGRTGALTGRVRTGGKFSLCSGGFVGFRPDNLQSKVALWGDAFKSNGGVIPFSK